MCGKKSAFCYHLFLNTQEEFVYTGTSFLHAIGIMTEEIFRQDGYVFEFESIVTGIDGDWVELEGTAFYPGGGGQVHDTGAIGGFPVTEVKYDKENIVHLVPGHKLSVNDKIWCSVNWQRRYDLMQGHTAEHILFNALHRQDPEIEIVKIYIAPDSKYVIINKDMSIDMIGEAVKFANQVIEDNHPVIKSVMSRDDPELERVRIKLDRIEEDEITVVEIGDVDIAACSGIHVMETSEIGAIFVDRKVSAGKDGFAIHFRIGEDAKHASMNLANLCLQTIEILGSKPEDLVKTVQNMKSELESCKKNLKRKMEALLKSETPTMESDGISLYTGIFNTNDKTPLIESAESHKKNGDAVAYLSVDQNISVILGSGSDKVNCKTLMQEIMTEFGGRGGGKLDFSQGGIQDISIANEVMGRIIEKIKDSINKG